MNVGTVRLVFGVFWLAVGLVLVFRNQIAPENVVEKLDSPNIGLGSMLAFMLAAWNIVRWYMGRSKDTPPPQIQPRRKALEPRRTGEVPAEYNPDLDFTRPAEPKDEHTEAK